MTLMCIERSQSPTHKGSFPLGGRQSTHNNHRRNSCSPPLAKNAKHSSSKLLERSDSDSGDSTKSSRSNSSRYKTELCRPFEESGTCKYGDKCQFAHGIKELRSMARHPKYKTELCRTFHSTGLCPYGPRCHFIHNSESTRKTLMSNLTTRPKPLTSLGSAGDISPSSSQGGTPTGMKSFDDLYQQNPFEFQAGHNLFSGYGVSPDLLDAMNSFGDKEDFNFQLELSPGPLTPTSPGEASPFRLAIFDGFLKL